MKLSINKLSFSYAGYEVLKEIELELGLGEMLSIVGPNGSGKSTLLKCINRILKTKHNTVLIDDKDTSTLTLKELAKVMGYVPQNSTSTFPFTVFDVVLMGRKPYIHWNIGEKDNEIVAEMLDFLGIGHLAMRHFDELSGGEQQKVIIARALAQQPQLMLLDEPTSSLDIKHQLEILCMLRGLARSGERSVVVSMHDLNMASNFSDRMVMIKKGSIFAVGTPKEVITEKNIEAVYGIKANVALSAHGKPQITPIVAEESYSFYPKLTQMVEAKHP
ncbi:MAG: ABC transporter ATP-binding protein [Candidatus Bathyarchaeota archaeon]|nr:ABC transporter ATP-binding protein [Candidatus Bathyarchaeota archaeon]